MIKIDTLSPGLGIYLVSIPKSSVLGFLWVERIKGASNGDDDVNGNSDLKINGKGVIDTGEVIISEINGVG